MPSKPKKKPAKKKTVAKAKVKKKKGSFCFYLFEQQLSLLYNKIIHCKYAAASPQNS